MTRRHTMRWEGQQVPVPYVTTWTSEKGWIVRHCPFVDAPAWCSTEGGPGIGRPNVSKMQPERCRDVVIRVRCQVCGTKLGRRKSRYAIEVFNAKPDPKGRRVLEHPWCCRSCMRDADRWCPALRRLRPRILRVHRHEMVLANTADPGLPVPPDSAWPSGARFAIGYARIVVLDASPVDRRRL